MITAQPGYEQVIQAALQTQAALTDAQKATLSAEISGDPEARGYAGKSATEVAALLNHPYSQDNPQEQGRVAVSEVSGALFKQWCRYRLSAVLATNPTVGQKWAGLSAALMPTISDSEPILATSTTLASFAVGMKADGVCTQAQIDALFSEPDPSYQAVIYHPSRARTLFGDGALIEVSDVEVVL